MVVHYPRTVWKNSHAEHEVTGKNIQFIKKKNTYILYFFSIPMLILSNFSVAYMRDYSSVFEDYSYVFLRQP